MGLKPRAGASTRGEVDAWFAARLHPQTELMRLVRAVILSADARVDECVKWSCPTFTYNGNIVSINPAAKSHVSLMFHTGGNIPGRLPFLSGSGETCKYMRFEDAADLKSQKADLEKVIRAWCDWKA